MENFIQRRDLVTSKELRGFSNRTNSTGFIYLALHLTLIGFFGWLVWISYGSWWIIFAWIPYGLVLVFLFAPLHECIHGTAFRSKPLNALVGAVAGFLLLLPARYFRSFHFQHHRFTNDPERDPELQVEQPRTSLQYVVAMSGVGSYWWPQICTLAKHSLGRVDVDFIPKAEHRRVILEARIHVFAYAIVLCASLILSSNFAVIFWVVPAMFGMVGLRMFLLAEHAGCENSKNMLLNTRTTLTNSIMKLIAWNMPYHCEHHLFPAVPFHQLPQLHNHVKDRLASVSPGYLNFHVDYLRSLQKPGN